MGLTRFNIEEPGEHSCLRTPPREFNSAQPRRTGVVPTFLRQLPSHGQRVAPLASPFQCCRHFLHKASQQLLKLHTKCGAQRGRQAPASFTAVPCPAGGGERITRHSTQCKRSAGEALARSPSCNSFSTLAVSVDTVARTSIVARRLIGADSIARACFRRHGF